LHPREVTFTRYEALIQAVRAIAHVVLQECPDTVINVHTFSYPFQYSAGSVTLAFGTTTANIWNSLQQFNGNASSTAFSALDALQVGRNATTTIRGEANATSTFAGGVQANAINVTSTTASYRIEPAKKMSVSVFGPSEHLLRENEAIFQRLTRVDEIRTIPESVAPDNTIPVQAGSLRIFLHLDGVIDTDKEKRRLENELAEKTRYITSLQNRLDDPKFSSRAPEHILTQTKTLLDEALIAVDHLKESLARFER
jgi:valyl-tRNA synthetase